MIITHYLQADLTAAQQQFPPIRVMQGDNDSRAIAISLYDGAAAYEIPQDAEAVVRFRRADGSGGVYDTLPNGDTAWSLEENTVTVMLAPQVMAAWGSVAVSVALVYRQQILGIVPFSVTVLPDPAVGTTSAEDYFNYSVLKRVDAALENQVMPAYWQQHLEEKVPEIRNILATAGRNRSAFLWYNDCYFDHSSKMAPALLAYLSRHTPIHKTIFGGDALPSRSNPNSLHEWHSALRNVPNHHSVVGNGDRRLDDPALYSMMLAAEEDCTIVRGGDFSYYIDDPNEQTRYLYLDTSSYTAEYTPLNDSDFLFALQALRSAPQGWHIVAIGHIWYLPSSPAAYTVGQIPMCCQMYLQLFGALNNRQSGSYTLGGTAYGYDFTGSTARVEFCIGGHAYGDHSFISDEEIPVILTEAENYMYGALPYTTGTVTESSINAIVADYGRGVVEIIRIGRGESWTVAL